MSARYATAHLALLIALAAALLLVGAAGLRAQVPMHVLQGPTTENFGSAVCSAGDGFAASNALVAVTP